MKLMALGFRGIPGLQGGIETHAQQLYPILARLGCEVTVIGRKGYVERGRYQAVDVVPLFAPRRTGLEAFVHTLVGVLWAAMRRPDLLHIHAVGPGLLVPLARLLGLRVVFTHHGQDYRREKWGRFARWMLRLGERFAVRHANATIVISQEIQQAVANLYGVRATLIPNGVAAHARSESRKILAELGLQPGRYILSVGRLVAEKRHHDLVQAFSLLRASGGPLAQWQLVVAGAADHPSAYRDRLFEAAAATPGVVLAGFRVGEDLAGLYSHAGLFCLPSSHEGLPIALLEALSYGLPVVASDIEANVEVELPAASYFAMGNVSALAATLADVATTVGDKAAAAQRQAFVRARYDWDTVASQTLQVMRAACQGADQK
jgi:glycosyltransferase involved in cell wall biosynthesis